MSRTYKDRPSKIRYPEEQWDYKYYRVGDKWYFNYLAYPGVLTKKKKNVDSDWHWMTTPGWFINVFMNRPQRARGKAWERKIVKCEVDDVIDQDYPDVGRKPHRYYW